MTRRRGTPFDAVLVDECHHAAAPTWIETINSLDSIKEKVHTVTSDNVKEFAKHESIAKNLDAQFFFARPYASWERGLNENTNGLIRQYFPKKTQLTISQISKSNR